MSSRSMRLLKVAAIGVLLPTMCHAAAFGRNGTLKPPDFSTLAPDGAVVTGFSIKVDCAGVGAVKNVPDGWSFSAEARGESYVVRVDRSLAEEWLRKLGIPDRNASNREIEAVRLDLLFRGQWSDCVSAKAVVHLKLPQATGGWKESDVWLSGSMFEENWKPDPYPVPFEK